MKFNDSKDQIYVVDDDTDVQEVMRAIIEPQIHDDAFYVCNANNLIQKFNNWKEKLPRVTPYYAVKCNDNMMALKILASLGIGFDCASKEEIGKVSSLGVHPSRIIFANPTKAISHIQYAAEMGVDTTTFDNEFELHKIKTFYPSAKLLLRIRSDASKAAIPLGTKYGCDVSTEASSLLQLARKLNLNIIGICFHVGSDCGEPTAYERAVAAAYSLFKIAENLGFSMKVLDIGGGFPGNENTSIDAIAEVVNKALEKYFPVTSGTTIVAEPGRYFTASAFTLATQVHSKREVKDPETGAVIRNMYYVNDSIYCSFFGLWLERAIEIPIPLSNMSSSKTLPCSFWGQTCGGFDLILDNVKFPFLNVGDWIYFKNMGAYTTSSASTFNGFAIPKSYTILNKSTMLSLKNVFETFQEINYASP